MRLFYTTSDFLYRGRPHPGVPFLVSEDMYIIKPPSDYLLWIALDNLKTRSPATWKSYAETLHRYFSWLEARSLTWDALPLPTKCQAKESVVALYRDWLLGAQGSEAYRRPVCSETARIRTGQIMRFYIWAESTARVQLSQTDELAYRVR